MKAADAADSTMTRPGLADAAGLTLMLWDAPAEAAVIDDQSPSAGTMISGWNSVTVHVQPSGR